MLDNLSWATTRHLLVVVEATLSCLCARTGPMLDSASMPGAGHQMFSCLAVAHDPT